MNEVKIFDPEKNVYTQQYQCKHCGKYYLCNNSIWICKTCQKDICYSCQEIEHIGHDISKDLPKLDGNDQYGGYYIPTISITDDLILLEGGDYNPNMRMAKIPLIIKENADLTITLHFDQPDISKKIASEYNNLNEAINYKLKNNDYSSIILFSDGTII